MKSYLNSLNEREKWMVIAAVLSLVIYFYYQFLYTPLSNSVALKSSQLIEKTETLAWMNQVRQKAHSATKKQSVDNSQLLTLLATQLKNNETLKFPYQLQQTGSGDIQLTFDTVPFKLFMQWLAKLNDKYTITIKQFDVEHTNSPGVTKLMIIITAAG
ncbi:GspM family type II secretion system protein LspM [Legionella quateirensis]|uniref:General secretion pathway protein M n=1 Tax=Legionella quateirensis TaxID=45072 RepID=A0A378KSE4_9GAMM|nr:GspM family type II secretion system protein LspM [Legionella quateirensis]KTD51282.1 putative general secretion pathway protein YghD [Legionella quateirensis]STY17472.1 general secretion pathway protein M [Legionella quateirensis]